MRSGETVSKSSACWSFPPYPPRDRKSTRLNSSHVAISYAVFCLKKQTSWIRRSLVLTVNGIRGTFADLSLDLRQVWQDIVRARQRSLVHPALTMIGMF